MTDIERKIIGFQTLINVNRKKLRKAGFFDATLTRWQKGERVPSEEMAIKLAEVMDVPLKVIPHHKIV